MTAKRHHFVPQGFLRGFAIEGENTRNFVWAYDKRRGRAPRRKSVRSIAWRTGYYAQENDDGTEDLDTLETQLAQTIDNSLPQLIHRIDPIEGKLVTLSEDERGHLAFFMGLSLTRVPSFREGIEDIHSWIAQRALSLSTAKDLELAELFRKFGIQAEAKQWASIQPMVLMAQQIAESVLKKNFQFFVPPSSVPLVTSDNPVVFSGAASGLQGVGPAHASAELVMNLRSDLALVCTPICGHPDMSTFKLRPAEARKFNRGVVSAASLRVFSNTKSHKFDSFVKKYAGKEQRVIT